VRFRRFMVVAVVAAIAIWAAIAAPAGAGQVRPPTNVSARAVSGPQVELTWDQLTAADGFRVLRATTTGGPYGLIATTSGVQETFTDTTVSPVTTYYYVVQATYQGRVSRSSAQVSATTGPARPRNPRAAAGTATVQLTWDAAAGAARYQVLEVGPGGDGQDVRGSTTQTAFADNAVSNDAWYSYKIRAVAASGATEDSVVLTVHTGAPTQTTITASPTEAGQSVVFTAKVTPVTPLTGPYQGRVDFYVDGGLAGWQDNIDYIHHTALKWMLTLAEGEHVVYAHYQGLHGSDGTALGASSSALRVHVVKPAYGSVGFGTTTLYRYGEGSWPKTTAIADVTGDGRLDALATTETLTGDPDDFKLSTFAQQPQPGQNLTFGPTLDTSGARGATMRIATGDLDGDGDQDVAVASDGGIDLFRQSGGALTSPPSFLSTLGGPGNLHWWGDVRVADMDGDGHADLVVAGPERLMVYPGIGDGSFGAPVPVAEGPHYVEVGDIDADGDLDIVAWVGADIDTYTHTTATTYELRTHETLPLEHGQFTYAIGIGDVTGDGRNDMVVTVGGNIPYSRLFVYPQTTTGQSGEPVVYPVRDSPEPLALADMNGDGRRDVVIAHGSYDVGVMLQRPDGALGREQLQHSPLYATSFDLRGLAVGDLTGDGRPDIARANYNYGLVVVPTN
jgi:FG-GAP-like repeat